MWVDLTLSTVRKPKREGFDDTEMQHSGMKNGGNVLKKKTRRTCLKKMPQSLYISGSTYVFYHAAFTRTAFPLCKVNIRFQCRRKCDCVSPGRASCSLHMAGTIGLLLLMSCCLIMLIAVVSLCRAQCTEQAPLSVGAWQICAPGDDMAELRANVTRQ